MAVVTPTILGRLDGVERRPENRRNVKRLKTVLVKLADTVDSGDTVAITLANYGLSNIKAIQAVTHTTDNSVIVIEDPTTSVTSGVLSVTIGGSTANKTRGILLFGEEA